MTRTPTTSARLTGGGRSCCRTGGTRWCHSLAHDVSAHEGNTNHEQPARNNGKDPENISEGDCEAVLGEYTIERVEITIVDRQVLPCLGRVKVGEGLDLSGSGIQPSAAHNYWRWLGRHLEEPEAWWTGTPGVAEDWLVVAVKVSHVRSGWVDTPKQCGLVKSLLNLAALPKAGRVSSGKQNPPFFRLRALRLDARANGIFPAAEAQDVEGLASDLSCYLRRSRFAWIWNVRRDLVEPVLSLDFDLLKRRLLRSDCENWECQKGCG